MIFESLPIGRENALSSREICRNLGINIRELTRRIYVERRAGKAICSTCGDPRGYYAARDQQELKFFCRRLDHRAAEIQATSEACRMIIPSLPVKENAK